jgi:hypothetical protein
MPSPNKQTRLEIDPSECLHPINTNEGQAFIPSILPGQIVTLPGSIKVIIREPDMPILGGAAYKESTIIALKATMPGLNRRCMDPGAPCIFCPVTPFYSRNMD